MGQVGRPGTGHTQSSSPDSSATPVSLWVPMRGQWAGARECDRIKESLLWRGLVLLRSLGAGLRSHRGLKGFESGRCVQDSPQTLAQCRGALSSPPGRGRCWYTARPPPCLSGLARIRASPAGAILPCGVSSPQDPLGFQRSGSLGLLGGSQEQQPFRQESSSWALPLPGCWGESSLGMDDRRELSK